MENKEYYVGIDYGTSNSCIGIYMNSKINIVPNRIGERSTPSLVLFDDKKIYVGEETLTQKIKGNYLINEVKRFIGLNYEEFLEEEYDKKLNYEVINQDGIPKVKVFINGQENFYSAEEISAFIIKKMVQSAEDFINESEMGVKISKAIITVPVHFSENQKEAIKSAARLADIEILRIINEPTAAALSYGFGKDLIIEKQEKRIIKNESVLDVPPLANACLKNKEEIIIVLDLGGGTFDISLLNCRKLKEDDGLINFETIGTIGDNNLGGSDFDIRLIDYCIKRFCEENEIDQLDIKTNKNTCKRLKIKCEAAKKLLSQSNETFININDLYYGKDFSIKISKNKFEDLCKDLFKKIDIMIDQLLEEKEKKPKDIDFIILVGGATRMTGIRDIITKKFGENKIKDSIDPDEAVAFGATLECTKLGKKEKINFNLQDIIPYNLGISVKNPNDENNDLMRIFIKKFSKIPYCSEEKTFKIYLSNEKKDIYINVYEGNDKYAKNNKKLGVVILNDINKIGEIQYKIKFSIDVNSKLTIHAKIESVGLEINQEIKQKITNAIVDKKKKKIKIIKNKLINPLNSFIENIGTIKQNFKSPANITDKKRKLIECSNEYEQLIDCYKNFIKDNDYVIEKMFFYTKELFPLYSERISLKIIDKDEEIDNIPEVINKIKDGMANFISDVGYITELLDIFTNIKEDHKNEFILIFTNYLELMNNEGISIIKNKDNKKFSRYYSKLYFEKAYYCSKKYIKEENLGAIDRNIKHKLEEQQKINESKLNEINSFSVPIEKLVKGKEFLIGHSGFTFVIKLLEKLEDPNNLSEEEIQDILDMFQNWLDIYDDNNGVEKGYCLANIIKIRYKILKEENYDKLMEYIQKLEFTMKDREDEEYTWYKEIKEIISEIKEKYC